MLLSDNSTVSQAPQDHRRGQPQLLVKSFGERNVDSRFPVQLEEDGGGSTELDGNK